MYLQGMEQYNMVRFETIQVPVPVPLKGIQP